MCKLCLALFFVFPVIPWADAQAGTISGRITRLDRITVPKNIQISVSPNGGQITIDQSTGEFSIPTVNGRPTNITFTADTSVDANVVGLNGSATVSGFDVFLPVLRPSCQSSCEPIRSRAVRSRRCR